MKRRYSKPAVEPQVAPKQPDPAPLPWRVGVWGGVPNYQCRDCHYDSCDITAIRQHCRIAHGKGA